MIKQLAAHIKDYKTASIKTGIYVSFEVLMEVAIPFLMAYLIDYGIEAGNMNLIIGLGLGMLLAAGLSLFFGLLSAHYAAKASAGYAKNLRQAIFYK
ncbi:MAG: ABC transporter ATP-binding protein, partial [Eubacteriaceae bacterium]